MSYSIVTDESLKQISIEWGRPYFLIAWKLHILVAVKKEAWISFSPSSLQIKWFEQYIKLYPRMGLPSCDMHTCFLEEVVVCIKFLNHPGQQFSGRAVPYLGVPWVMGEHCSSFPQEQTFFLISSIRRNELILFYVPTTQYTRLFHIFSTIL